MQRAPKLISAESVLLVTEAYNVAEGQSEASLIRAVSDLEAIAARHNNAAVAVIDPNLEGVAKPLLSATHPHIDVWHLPSQSYDGQKNFISQNAQSELIVFLDGDCHPLYDSWLDKLLAPFADVTVSAVGGTTLYEDFSLAGVAMTILDFGYLFGNSGQALGCYASNNVAFRRKTLLEVPIPHDGEMRCLCYKHAQMLQRAHKPVLLEGGAVVVHELPDIEKERHRRGYDHVAALWTDPQLAETSWLSDPQTARFRIMFQNWNLALDRLKLAPPELNITRIGYKKIVEEISRLMLMDEAGIASALEFGEVNGLNQRALVANKALCEIS